MFRVLSLDPGVNFGWATICPDRGERHGTENLARRHDGTHRTDRHAAYFDRASNLVTRLIEECQPVVVLVEEMAGTMKGEAARTLPGMRACALVVIRRRELIPIECNSKRWQGWAGRRGWQKADDGNDALWMAKWWLSVEQGKLIEVAA